MTRAVYALSCFFASGCWLIGDMGELTNEGAAGGAGGSGGSGAGGATGGGGMGATGGSGGTGAAGSCEAVTLNDGDFEILAICHGLSQARISADPIGMTVVGQVKSAGFVQSFDPNGVPLASSSLPLARGLRVQAVGTATNRTSIVVGGVDTETQLSVLGEVMPLCEGLRCGFMAAFDTSMEGAETQFWDAGSGGSIVIEDVDAGQVKELDNDLVLALGGTIAGEVNVLGAELQSMDAAGFVVTANIQTGTPASPTAFVVPAASNDVNLAINQKGADDLLVFITYSQSTLATFSVVDPLLEMFVGAATMNAGSAKSITRTPMGGAYAVVDASGLTVHRFGSESNSVGPFAGVTSGRVRGQGNSDLWIASGFVGNANVGGLEISSKGELDPVIILIDATTMAATPKVLSSASEGDDQFTDLAVVNSQPGPSIYATLTFNGTIDVGGTPLTADANGSTLLVRIAN